MHCLSCSFPHTAAVTNHGSHGNEVTMATTSALLAQLYTLLHAVCFRLDMLLLLPVIHMLLLTLSAHARSESYCSCPVCVCGFLPPRASRPQNIGTYVFTATRKTFIIVIFAKNALFRSYGVICLPPMPPTTLNPQTTNTKGIS